MREGCLPCDLHSGRQDLPGGVIHSTSRWHVSHCIGPLGLGSLIVLPQRHVVHVWDLNEVEQSELGPLLARTADVVRELCAPHQVYVCLWSHAGGQPGHIHFVVQPAPRPEPDGPKGPALQMQMFDAGVLPPRDDVEAFAKKAAELF